MNFVGLLRKASANGWCTNPECTTCGASEFRAAVAASAGSDGWFLAEDLASTPINTLSAERDWISALQIAFQYLQWPGQHEKVLEAWAEQIQDIRVADTLFFYVFGRLPFRGYMAPLWVNRCIELAVESRDESFIETLLWKLPRARLSPEFMALAQSLSTNSTKIAKALGRGA